MWKSSVSKTPTPPRSKKQAIASTNNVLNDLIKKDKSRRIKVLKDEPLGKNLLFFIDFKCSALYL